MNEIKDFNRLIEDVAGDAANMLTHGGLDEPGEPSEQHYQIFKTIEFAKRIAETCGEIVTQGRVLGRMIRDQQYPSGGAEK